MSIELLKSELASLKSEERRQIMGYLISLRDRQNPDYPGMLAHRIDDPDPAHWFTAEALDRHFGPIENIPE